MQEARDDVFCFRVARRAVARAALHLGVKDMSVEALDSVSEILISFLQRFGKSWLFQSRHREDRALIRTLWMR